MIAPALQAWIGERCGSALRELHSLGGGSINEMYRVCLADGRSLVLKTRAAAPAGFFSAEAEGLRALSAAGARVPAVLAVDAVALLLEDLGEGTARGDCWEGLARQLLGVHAVRAGTFGWDSDGFIGLTRQCNARDSDGHRFFAERRLLFQGELAHRQRRLDRSDLARLEALCARLPQLLPLQPAVLLHGDLWSGNAHVTAAGQGALLDPACHYGWAEADLAMSLLFGAMPEAFYRAYESGSGLDRGWRERAPLYNLYHLLNHLNLFGAGYLAAVRSVLVRFS